jgi:Peptidase A4 family
MPRRIPRVLAGSLIACLLVTGLLAGFSPAASATTASGSARAAALAQLRHLMVGQDPDHRVGHSVRVNGQNQVQSTNWSGYADDNSAGNTYSTVTGNWTEPAVTCSSRTTQYAAFWVGIDGYSSNSVEQDGTLAECYHGTAYYFSWWEMYPTNSVQTVGTSVRPGDSISASVVRTGTSYTLSLTDSTRPADSFTTTQTCSNCANSSAEWIAEAPSSSRGVLPLANFGTWTESGATVKSGSTSGVISTFPDDEITMVDSSGRVKAQPGPLSGSGSGFTVTWERTS